MIPIFDGHNDSLTKVFSPETGEHLSFINGSDTGQLDYPKAVAGGMLGGIFAIFTPPPPGSPERDEKHGMTLTSQGCNVNPRSSVEYAYARDFTEKIIDLALRLEMDNQDKLGIVRVTGDFQRFRETNRLAMVLHIEGGEAVHEDLSNLDRFYQLGVRSLGLVWSRPNVFGEGVPFRFPSSPDTGPGLTNAGKQLIKACNKIGMMVDLAHLNEKGFWDVAKIIETPLVVSHTAVYALSPSSRNLTDEQIEAVGQSGGLVGIMFEPVNLLPDRRPNVKASLEDLARHIDYVAQRIGVEHVAFGSDFDGAQMPDELGNASQFQKLIQVLQEKGYQGEDLEKIAYRNWLRVIGESWRKD